MELEPLEAAVLQKLLDGDHPVLDALRQQLPDLAVKERKYTGVGFLLYVDDGLITMLEGYTYGEPWPQPVGEFSLSYHHPERTADWAKLAVAAEVP